MQIRINKGEIYNITGPAWIYAVIDGIRSNTRAYDVEAESTVQLGPYINHTTFDISGNNATIDRVGDDFGPALELADYLPEPEAPEIPQGVAVADATDGEDVVTQFNALLASLRTAELIASE